MAKGRTEEREFHRMGILARRGLACRISQELKLEVWLSGRGFAWHSEGLELEFATPNTDAGLRGGKEKGVKNEENCTT